MTSLNIVADENIPLVDELFQPLGHVTRLPGRSMTKADLADADVLLVRSVTPVNTELLERTAVRFVGTCTIGTDHIDQRYCDARAITWTNAPGCNANSVVEYVLSVLARLRPHWRRLTVGIVGAGNVGGSLYRRLRSLGVTCAVVDPFKTHAQQDDLVSLSDLSGCDVLCLHAPLTHSGPFPSYHLLNETVLQSLKPGCLLISAGRGGVVDNQALKRHLQSGADLSAVLDVWEPEPDLDLGLLALTEIGTAHIAGYSYDGKLAGAVQVYNALMRFLCREAELDISQTVAQFAGEQRWLNPQGDTLEELVNQSILMAYDVAVDSEQLKRLLTMTPAAQVGVFDELRKHYPRRREFSGFKVRLPIGFQQSEQAQAALLTLGFAEVAQ